MFESKLKEAEVTDMWWDGDDFHAIAKDGTHVIYKGAHIVRHDTHFPADSCVTVEALQVYAAGLPKFVGKFPDVVDLPAIHVGSGLLNVLGATRMLHDPLVRDWTYCNRTDVRPRRKT